MQSILSSAAQRRNVAVARKIGAGELKMNWTKPGRFGRTIALWALNRIALLCFGEPVFVRFRESPRHVVMLSLGYRDCNCPDKPKT